MSEAKSLDVLDEFLLPVHGGHETLNVFQWWQVCSYSWVHMNAMVANSQIRDLV